MSDQNYEDYWRFTNAYTDYNGDSFLTVLRESVNFIDEYSSEEYSPDKYSRLQSHLLGVLSIENLASIRKAINQLVKMGFIEPFLESYNQLSKDYLSAATNRKRKAILSKVIYSKSGFDRSVSNRSDLRQINFLIQTMEEVGSLSKKDIVALMLVDISTVEKGYLDVDELGYYRQKANESGFLERKYNQVGYLVNLLKKMTGLYFRNESDSFYFEEDARRIFDDFSTVNSGRRDSYLHRVYKKQLKEESELELSDVKCMLEEIAYPVLVASHIKPFRLSSPDEAYDPNNGLLLSRTIDSLFDLLYISFDDNGGILFSKRISSDVIDFWSRYSINECFITEERKFYLAFHRNLMLEKDNEYLGS